MFTRNTSSSNILMSNANNSNRQANQASMLTLPITCHICLGKVKDPSVCPNLHVFCSFCIDIWLEKTKQCPTCRIQINKENPCRRILGGVENFDEVDVLKPSEFSQSPMRKARYLNLFQQYEDEINRLNTYIDSLNADVKKLKDANNGIISSSSLSKSPQSDMLQILKDKLQTVQSTLDETVKERDKLKEHNKKLESENSILIQDIYRLKSTLNEKNSQMSSKYTLAALESKVEGYEKEIKQLQKALDKSDRHIADLESKINNGENLKDSSSAGIFASLSSSSVTSNDQKKFIKPDVSLKSDMKIVKFSEKIDTIPPTTSPSINMTSPTSYITSNSLAKQSVISNDRFYGSPSKPNNSSNMNVPTTPTSHSSVMSFSERMKKNCFNTNESANDNQSNFASNNDSHHSSSITNNNNPSHQFLFSPMKRLRLDEFNSNEMSNKTTLQYQDTSSVNDTSNDGVRNNLFKSNNSNSCANHLATPYNHNYRKELRNYDFKENNDEYNNILGGELAGKKLDIPTTSEFIDCIELLNQAEKKVQNRQISPKSNSSSNSHKSVSPPSTKNKTPDLPEKYLRAVNILENTADRTANQDYLNYKSANMTSANGSAQIALTKSILSSLSSSSSTSSSSSSSGNSLSANISSTGSNSSNPNSFNGFLMPNTQEKKNFHDDFQLINGYNGGLNSHDNTLTNESNSNMAAFLSANNLNSRSRSVDPAFRNGKI